MSGQVSVLIQQLYKEDLIEDFMAYYNEHYSNLNSFILAPIEQQVFILTMYLAEKHNYLIHADKTLSVICYYDVESEECIKHIRKTGDVFIYDYNNDDGDLLSNYIHCFNKTLELIKNPF